MEIVALVVAVLSLVVAAAAWWTAKDGVDQARRSADSSVSSERHSERSADAAERSADHAARSATAEEGALRIERARVDDERERASAPRWRSAREAFEQEGDGGALIIPLDNIGYDAVVESAELLSRGMEIDLACHLRRPYEPGWQSEELHIAAGDRLEVGVLAGSVVARFPATPHLAVIARSGETGHRYRYVLPLRRATPRRWDAGDATSVRLDRPVAGRRGTAGHPSEHQV